MYGLSRGQIHPAVLFLHDTAYLLSFTHVWPWRKELANDPAN
jgi:hypothetical protein